MPCLRDLESMQHLGGHVMLDLCVVLCTVVGAEGNEKAWHMTQ